ncbi:MAG: hypothetical protein C4327_08140 [Meiothermus sp.]|mgnify:CR=1 FL=1
MNTTATVAQTFVRLGGLIQIVLGLGFWLGVGYGLVPVHILVGFLVVLSLWTLATVGLLSKVRTGQVGLAFVWGLITLGLGMGQGSLLPGELHWIVQAFHLLVGLGAIGQGEALARAIRQRPLAARSQAK